MAAYPSLSGVLTCTTRTGATLTRVTGTARLRSSQTWVMPTFSPTIAFVAICGPVASLGRELRPEPRLGGRPDSAALHADAPPGESRAERCLSCAAGSPPATRAPTDLSMYVTRPNDPG